MIIMSGMVIICFKIIIEQAWITNIKEFRDLK